MGAEDEGHWSRTCGHCYFSEVLLSMRDEKSVIFQHTEHTSALQNILMINSSTLYLPCLPMYIAIA